MQNLSQFKKALQPGTRWMVRYSHAPEKWQEREVVKLQTNAVAFMHRLESMTAAQREAYRAKALANPQGNASWHWWGEATTYMPSPETPGAIRHCIGTHADNSPDWSTWMEYRPYNPATDDPTAYLDNQPKGLASSLQPTDCIPEAVEVIAARIGRLTDQNDHTGAVLALAEFVECPYAVKVCKAVQAAHVILGHLPPELDALRGQARAQALKMAREIYGPASHDHINGEF